MIVVFQRFKVKAGFERQVVRATRAYQQQTRRETGNVRCELLRCTREPGSALLYEVFHDSHARTAHALTAHAQEWRTRLTPLIVDFVREEEFLTVLAEAIPPPLPRAERPAVESSATYGASFTSRQSDAPKPGDVPLQFVLDVEAIEVASAKDHLPLRRPSPCMVIGAFAIDEKGAQGIGRTVYRFTAPKSMPASLVGAQRLLDVPIPVGRLPLKVGVVMFAVEENGGRDVQALYQTLADGLDLSFWPHNAHNPAPCSFVEAHLNPSFPPNMAQRVQVLRRSEILSDALDDDTWAGSALGYFELTQERRSHLARFHTASEDRQNDWLFAVRCGVK